jgi:cyanophycin synthetase
VLEKEDDEEWIILYEPGGARVPVTPVAAIPATMAGAARLNISNAQHAICACHALGIRLDAMREGLSTFDANFENNPGRLNIYHQLPFTVMLDFAHNPDGMEKLCVVVDQMKVPGRKILAYAAAVDLSDDFVKAFACSPIGHFDYFVCRNYPDLEGRMPDEIPSLMKAALLDAGVPEERITLEIETESGAQGTLRMARPGDLVVFSPGTDEIEPMWREIVSFQPAFSDRNAS